MMTLYHNDMSVCAAKVRTALAEKKLSWEGVHLDLRAGDAQKPEYLKLNPNAVVPTLVHDSRTIIESTVICEYIDDEWPDHPLKPDHTWERAQMRLLDEATGRKRSRRSCGPFLMHRLSPSVARTAAARSGEMVGRHSASGSSRAIPIDDRAWIRLSVFCARIAPFREAF
jgi:glutathione S-transferase